MPPKPQASGRPHIYLKFFLNEQDGLSDEGVAFRKFEFKAMANGGYVIRATLFDPHSNLLRTLVDQGYLEESRVHPAKVLFQIKWSPDAQYPEQATKPMVAYVTSLQAHGGSADVAYLEFVAIDPPSWYLNTGDAAGICFKGRVSDVIKQVVRRYAPGLDLEVSQTTDSPDNRFWMMRQDPKTFIQSLLDWSSSLTPLRTTWVVTPGGTDGTRLIIKEQGELRSRQRGFYRYHSGEGHDTIKDWALVADNALSLSATKLVTSGLSAVSGQYLDRVTDTGERLVYAKDLTTPNKKIAWVDERESFEGGAMDGAPPAIQTAGWTAVSSVPEVYTAGDVGRRYEEYIDGRARGAYLDMANLLFRARFQVIGHGIWSDCEGLGVDTFFVRWLAPGNVPYFLTGNWLAYGFHHVVTRKFWTTDVYGARFDFDANARRVGSGAGSLMTG